MNGAAQQLDHSRVASARRWSLPAWKPDRRPGNKPEGDWHDLPDGFVTAVRTATKFADRQPTAKALMGVSLSGSEIYASDNRVAVAIEVGGNVPTAAVPLPVAELLIKRGAAPAGILVRDRFVAFAWDDGTWIEFASLHEVPRQLLDFFSVWREPEWQIPADWKKDFRTAVRFCDESILIGPDSITTGFGQSEFFCEVATPVKDFTTWSRTVLSPVISVAERIDFSSHPNGGCFAFRGGRGFVARRV